MKNPYVLRDKVASVFIEMKEVTETIDGLGLDRDKANILLLFGFNKGWAERESWQAIKERKSKPTREGGE